MDDATENAAPKGMLTKGLALLVALGEYPDGAGVSTLSKRENIPVSTVHRLLGSMVPLGFVRFDEERRRYFLGLKVFELAHYVSSTRSLSESALPVMREVTKATGETTFLAICDGTELVYIQRVNGQKRVQVVGSVGERGPIHATSLGKSLLAFLPEQEREEIVTQLSLEPTAKNTIVDIDELREDLERTRKREFAVSDEEREDGIRSVGLPVIDPEGRAVVAISVAAPVFRISQEELERFVPVLREAACEIRMQLSVTDSP